MPENLTEHIPGPQTSGFLANGGEMGALISAQDWSGSALGSPAGWPRALKSMVATLLSSPQPIIMGWGPEFLSFFNDSALPMIGARFNGSLGRPAAEQWTDSWGQLGPMARKAFGGQGSHYENMPFTLLRNDRTESTWWTLSFLPFRDDDGAVVGICCFPVETTENVLAEQRRAQEQKGQTFRVGLGDALRGAVDPKSLMMIAAEKLGLYLDAGCVGYGEVDASGERVQIHHDWTAPGSPSVVGTHQLDTYGPAMIAQLRAGRTVAVNDTATDPLTALPSCHAAYAAISARAFIDAPLVENGRLAVIFFVLDTRPRVWTYDEKALVAEVAVRTLGSLQRLRAELDVRQMNRTLDQRTTELLSSETALRQSQKLEALGQLTGGVAHDFNNLLAVINSSVELLRSNKLPVDRHGHYLNLIYDTVGRAVKLTSQLLAFARQQPLSPEVFDVDLQVQGVVDLVRPLMGPHVQILHQLSDSNACFVEADINQFETALVNLAVNARDAMHANGQLVIKVQEVDGVPAGPGRDPRSGDFIAISVSDTGSGIASEKLETIFEPFYTTKEVGKGTGLGLSQVFGFAKQSGGEVDVRSELGSGSVFTLYLSRAENIAAPQALAALPEQGMDNQGMGVLVVEDNETLAQMACEILDVLGYRTVWAANAAAALDLLAGGKGCFDLVFSDVVMPGMNGIEFGELVRKRYPALPVVLTSGYNAVMAEQGRYGFELILKPYTTDTLVRVFRKVIAEHALPSTNRNHKSG
ncbi:ATP-binding protein [Polaromonas sp.]|uniref:GAF domain-containing hybrid sensor histidine kinase/response regulator n=1 Tax=Polaromonas sp. TaxID=1869339 RepID=UPI003BB7F63C